MSALCQKRTLKRLPFDVRFTPEIGHWLRAQARAKSGIPLFDHLVCKHLHLIGDV